MTISTPRTSPSAVPTRTTLPADSTNRQPAASAGGSRAAALRPIVMVIAEVGGSLAAFYIARALGADDLAAYLWACLPPLIAALAGILRARRLDAASMMIVAFNLLSAAFVGIGSHSPDALLYKDCVVTAVVGVTFLASTRIGKPLTHLFALRFRENERERFEQLWAREPRYRTLQRRICVVWGVAFLVEAAAKTVVVANMSFDAAYGVTQVLPFLAVAVAAAYTIRTARAARRAGSAARIS